MAEYIDRDLIKWYGCNFEEPSCDNRECSGCSHAECSHTQVMQIPTADVIEREQYEELKKENIELKINNDDAEKRFCHAMDEKVKLRSKIDNAIEESYKIRQEVLYSGNECYEPNDVLYIIDEISKLFEEL